MISDLIEQTKLIAIIRGVSGAQLVPLCQAIYDGGIRLVEITYASDGSNDITVAKQIRMLTETFSQGLHFGAGTVLTQNQVMLTKEAGGEFIISPNVNAAVIQSTKRAGMVSIPGAMTPSEIYDAHLYGADFVKLFPAAQMGPDYIKAIRAPLSHIKLLAVGGVHSGNIPLYLKAGISGFGIGSDLTRKDLLQKEDYAGITEITREYVRLVRGEV